MGFFREKLIKPKIYRPINLSFTDKNNFKKTFCGKYHGDIET